MFEITAKVLFFVFILFLSVVIVNLNTETFPWGAVVAIIITIPFLVMCIRIISDKNLTWSEKWNKLLGGK